MRKLLTIAAVLTSLLVLGSWLSPAARAGVVVNQTISLNMSLFNPCAGEVVEFSGDAHVLVTFTVDAAGGTHASTRTQRKNFEGVGLTSGDLYHLASVSIRVFNDQTNLGREGTGIISFLVIGQGPGNNSIMREVGHITFNPAGDATANFEKATVECI